MEVLLSIMITAVIVLIIGGAVRLSFSSVEKGERRMEYLERIRASLNIIDSQIQSEIPLIEDSQNGKKYYFRGEKDFMRFASNYSVWSGQKGYVDVSYKAASDYYGKLTLFETESVVGTSMERKVKLLDGLDSLSFEYFYKGPTDEKGRWVDQWTDDTNMPEKIKLHIGYGEKDLSLIIPLRARRSLSEAM